MNTPGLEQYITKLLDDLIEAADRGKSAQLMDSVRIFDPRPRGWKPRENAHYCVCRRSPLTGPHLIDGIAIPVAGTWHIGMKHLQPGDLLWRIDL